MGTIEDDKLKKIFNSQFSILPLLRVWEKKIAAAKEGNAKLYRQLLEEVKQHPELLQPITDKDVFRKHASLMDQMLSTIFPVTLSDEEDLYAINVPFYYDVVYASRLFKQLFLDADGNYINVPEGETGEKITNEKLAGAYQLILNKFYNVRVDGRVTSIHLFKDPETGLDKYLELELDTRFIDVYTDKELPVLPKHCTCGCTRISEILQNKELISLLPIENFRFEGLVIIHIKDVTKRLIINRIKNSLLKLHSFGDESVFSQLEQLMQSLAGLPHIHTAIKPFFRVNKHLVLSELISTNLKAQNYVVSEEKQQELCKKVFAIFKKSQQPLIINDLNEQTLLDYPFLQILYDYRFKSAIIAPLFNEENELLGNLIMAHKTEDLTSEHLFNIEEVLPLFTLALQKSQEHLDHQVDSVIKEQFTAVQDAVEWRFTQAALSYLTKKGKDKDAKIESIIFENVYPLYGAIDIRNSTVERNNAIQHDLLEQLHMARNIFVKAELLAGFGFPSLKEMQYRIDKYSDSVANILFAEEEAAIHLFLTSEIVKLFDHLEKIMPGLQDEIVAYRNTIDSPVKMLYHHRKKYEDSIVRINNEVSRFIDNEQKAAQQIFPHYFERFVTDGLDFNIYIGQSISPELPYHEFYLKNLKIWQLATLARTAQLTNRLEKELPLQLQTTQLILAHSQSISISFRPAERKFDVDGSYNIRYEIMKKRIDKVRIKDSQERFTQPGTIGIVYTQPSEAQDYAGYIEFLQSQGLLKPDIERYDLEEVQGISGLKGLRVAVNMDKLVQEPEPLPFKIGQSSLSPLTVEM